MSGKHNINLMAFRWEQNKPNGKENITVKCTNTVVIITKVNTMLKMLKDSWGVKCETSQVCLEIVTLKLQRVMQDVKEKKQKELYNLNKH